MQPVSSPESEPHFSVSEIAKLWKMSPDLVRSLFRNETGVLKIEREAKRFKRVYTTLRIPKSVLSRVHSKLSG